MTWLALVHPLVSLGAIAVMLAGIAVIAPKLFRLLRVEALAAAALAAQSPTAAGHGDGHGHGSTVTVHGRRTVVRGP